MHNPKVERALFAVSDVQESARFAEQLQKRWGVAVSCDSLLVDAFAQAGVEAAAVDLSLGAEGIVDGFDMLVADIPDFDEVVLSGANFPACIKSIELRRMALLRAAAKRFDGIAVVCDLDDCDDILQELADNKGATLYETRIRNAYDAFQMSSDYDYDIAEWLGAKLGIESQQQDAS